jgi:putative ABC transport system permease protein
MSKLQLILRSVRFYLLSNIWLALGVALSTAVLTGALIVGDSVDQSLVKTTDLRLGDITHAVVAGERYVTGSLGEEIDNHPGLSAAPVIRQTGMALGNGGELTVNGINVWGITEAFDSIAGSKLYEHTNRGCVVSENLAARLNLDVGSFILLRVEKATSVPSNAPFVSASDQVISWRLRVNAIAGKNSMGRLSMQNIQSAPFNVFVPFDEFNAKMENKNRANVIFINTSSKEPEKLIDNLVRSAWKLEDTGLSVETINRVNKYQVVSSRVFIDSLVAQKLIQNLSAEPVLTYFANKIQKGNNFVPYSFVSSIYADSLNENEIVLNQWAANDLNATVNDSVLLSYFSIGPLRKLDTDSAFFVIKDIVPIEGQFADRKLMPYIPGFSEVLNCRDWETGVPLNFEWIRQKDEDYWDEYKGTPKAYIAYSKAKELWQNRFGAVTALRIPVEMYSYEELSGEIPNLVDYKSLGVSIRPLKKEGLYASKNSTDFAQLFLGLSFFLLVSSIVLTVLLFRLNIKKRETEIGNYVALGFSKREIRTIFIVENLMISIAGGLFGLFLAVLYNRLVFVGLNKMWFDIVRTTVLEINIVPATLLFGFLISVVISTTANFFSLNKMLKKPVVQIQRKTESSGAKWVDKIKTVGVIIAFIVPFIVFGLNIFTGYQLSTSYFFIAGSLLLIAFLLLADKLLKPGGRARPISFATLVAGNLKLNKSRSITVIALMMISTFITISTGLNRKDLFSNADDPSSGTGGFLFWAESTVPVLHDLNKPAYRNENGFDSDFNIVQFSVASGDEASCLNLNRVVSPRLLGVLPDQLEGRFSFQARSSWLNEKAPWHSLNNDTVDFIPAIADQTVIKWSLGKNIGDTLLYQNESGEKIVLKLVGGTAASVFQGNVLISKENMLKHFPSINGSNVFLIEGKQAKSKKITEEMRLAFRDKGWVMSKTAERLAMFKSVENTYLSIFMILGGLGIFIGTIGLAIVLLRVMIDRRGEFATLFALGYQQRDVLKIIIYEFSILLLYGIVAGFISAILAVYPAVVGHVGGAGIKLPLLLIIGIIVNGLIWISLISVTKFKNLNIISSLRND